MNIILNKTKIKTILLKALIALIIILPITMLESIDEGIIHLFMPEPKPYAENGDSIFTNFEPSQKGYSVLVDLDVLVLTLYDNGIEIKSWPVSGGSKESPSPTGSWVVTGISNWNEGFGGSWISLSVPWGKYGIHGTVEPWAVGHSNISHGCIRMKNADVAELKKYMSAGVPVHIKYDNAPFRALKDGKVGSDVFELQMMLKLLGYYEGSPDGRFGSGTYRALCRFQTTEQIKVDGIVGKASWSLLHQRVAELGEDYLNEHP